MSVKWRIVLAAVVVVGLAGAVWGFTAALESAAPTLTTLNADRQETSFGDLTANALCAAGGTTIGLVSAVSFKPGTIPAQSPTRDEIAGLLQTPEETWAVSDLTGAQLRQALERSLSRAPLPNTAFLQVSGLQVVYNATQPRDQRIVSLTGTQGPIQPEQHYEVAMPLFLAQGGSGYFQIFDKDSIVRRGSAALADVIFQFRQQHPDQVYTGQGRILPSG